MEGKTIPEVLSDISGQTVEETVETFDGLVIEFFDEVYGELAERYGTSRMAVASEIYYRHPELLERFGEMVADNITENIILDER